MRRRALIATLAATAACGKETVHQPPIDVGVVQVGDASGAPPEGQEAVDPRALLGADVVTNDKVARRTLYTWTTREQAFELERDRILLTRDESPVHGASLYDQILARLADGGNALAKQLRTEAFAKARFAWPAPWATARAWPDESYGDQLIGVVLKPDAWIVKLRTTKTELEVVDLADRPIAVADALKTPERIAAVFFFQDVFGSGMGTVYGFFERAPYREYVLVNESMIESWSMNTPAEQAVMERGARAIGALAEEAASRASPKHQELFEWRVMTHWRGGQPVDSIDVYESALAFASPLYEPDATKLRDLAKALRELPGGGPSVKHQPLARFPHGAASIPSAKPRPGPIGTGNAPPASSSKTGRVKRPRGTY
jgi:hypothetical protein